MPATKTARKSTKRVSAHKRTPAAKQRGRTLSAQHKKSLAEGRTLSATVSRYLDAVNTPKRRGRKVTTESLVAKLSKQQDVFKAASGVEKVVAAQDILDIKARLATTPTVINIGPLEKEFVKVAKTFSANRRISYSAWREAGVSAEVLKKCGIARTRSK